MFIPVQTTDASRGSTASAGESLQSAWRPRIPREILETAIERIDGVLDREQRQPHGILADHLDRNRTLSIAPPCWIAYFMDRRAKRSPPVPLFCMAAGWYRKVYGFVLGGVSEAVQ